MITWAERAKAAISQTGQTGTAKTDEIPAFGVLAVSAVPTWAQFPASDQLVSVLAVPMPTVIEKTTYWHALDAAYLVHHFNCPACIASGRGSRYGLRCGIGAALWRAYSEWRL